ncbi:MAG: hypothetical protein ACYS1A_13250 [Planctomycetota bacterium]|jgi:hypothetical protein
MRDKLRSCWQNCGALDDKSLLEDKELIGIDAMEDSIGPLDERTAAIRGLITRFESCYHEADKEAEMIIQSIGSGQPPVESKERPAQRKQELQNSYDILSAWCQGDSDKCIDLDVGGIRADELVAHLGKPTDLKRWQVQRMIDQLKWALDRSYSYHVMALDIDGFRQPIELKAEEYYKDHLDFLNQTTATMINYTLDGEKSQMSLAMAIDLFEPCNWNFAGNLVIILKAIAGDLNPDKPFAPCSLNARLTPLRNRLRIISNTLKVFCEGEEKEGGIDGDLLGLLGAKTPVKRWLAASLDKTIRLHQGLLEMKQILQ